jgi:hypothetical protein
MGWIYASQRVLFCTLIPKRQELELMDLFTFLGQAHPGLVARYGLVVLAGFCFLAVICTLPMGETTRCPGLFAAQKSELKLLEVSRAAARIFAQYAQAYIDPGICGRIVVDTIIQEEARVRRR